MENTLSNKSSQAPVHGVPDPPFDHFVCHLSDDPSQVVVSFTSDEFTQEVLDGGGDVNCFDAKGEFATKLRLRRLLFVSHAIEAALRAKR
jgi:hypothetical protein